MYTSLAGAAVRGAVPTFTPFPLIRDAAGSTGMDSQIRRLEEERKDCLDFIDRTCAGAEEGKRDLSASEKETLGRNRDRVKAIDEQLTPLKEFAQLRTAHREGAAPYTPTPAPAGGQVQQGALPMGYENQTRTNLRGHQYETRGQVIVDLLRAAPKIRGGEQDHDARQRLLGQGIVAGASEDELRAIQNEITSDVPGLLPKPIVGAVQSDIDAARPFITSIGAKDLSNIPGKTFTRPYVTQHAVSGKQTAEKAELPSQKYTVGGVDFTKETHGGALDVSRQTMDWTSPEAWDALLADLQDVYAIDTEDVTADAFVTAVLAVGAANRVELGGANNAAHTIDQWATALYAGAAGVYGVVRRLPDAMWVSLDMYAKLGPITDVLKATTAGNGGGNSSVTSMAGNMLDLPRIVVPSFASGTAILGVKSKTEFYEEKIGLLSAVEPRLLGVEIAYGGYIAFGTLKPEGFFAIVDAT